MSEKILNTRIQLRYDSFTNWQKGNNDGIKDRGALLKKGELAVAYVADAKTETTPNDGTHPIMFKVGPGYFNELPWASALAADVYGWAKKVRGESTDVDYTKTIKTKNEETGVETTTTSTITVQTAIDALYQAIETLSGDAGTSIAELITIINKNKEDIADIVTEIGVASIGDKAATGLYAAIEAAQAAAEATAAADATAKANAAQAAAEATATSKANAAQAAAEATAAAALATARTEISAEIDADVTALETALDARLDVLEAIQHDTFATKAEMEAETAVREAAEAQVLADAQAYADEIKADLLGESDTLEGTYDTLREIAGWISTHEGETVTNLTQAIADEEAARKAADDALAERIKAYEDVKSTYATKSEVEAAQSAAADDATSKANAAEAAAKAHADSAAATAKSEAILAAAEDATNKADAAKSGAEATASADATAKANAAEAAAKAYAETKATEAKEAAIADAANKYLTEITTTKDGGLTVTNKNKIDIDDTITFIFDCGDAFGNPLN